MGEPRVRATTYTVEAALPDGLPDRNRWTLYVKAYGADGLYYVTDGFEPIGFYSRSAAKSRHPERAYPTDRRSDWFKRTYLMPLDEAVALAKRIVPKLTINNMTAEQYVAWVEARRSARGDS